MGLASRAGQRTVGLQFSTYISKPMTRDYVLPTSSATSALTASAIFLPSITLAFTPGFVSRNWSQSLAPRLFHLAWLQLEAREGAISRADGREVRERAQILEAILQRCEFCATGHAHLL